MKARCTVTVRSIVRKHGDNPRTTVTFAGKGPEESVSVTWSIPGWVGFTLGAEYEVDITPVAVAETQREAGQ